MVPLGQAEDCSLQSPEAATGTDRQSGTALGSDWKNKSQIQAVEISFLLRVAGFSFRDRMRSLTIQEELRVEPLLVHIENRYFWDLKGTLPWWGVSDRPITRRPRGRARTPSRDYVSWLAWERFLVPLDKLEEVPRGEGGLRLLCLGCCPNVILKGAVLSERQWHLNVHKTFPVFFTVSG